MPRPLWHIYKSNTAVRNVEEGAKGSTWLDTARERKVLPHPLSLQQPLKAFFLFVCVLLIGVLQC